jgi:hypothetical protein
MPSPTEYQPQSIRPSIQPLNFSEFKKLINGVDENRWGDALVYVGDDTVCPVVDLAEISGLPPAPEGSVSARWHGVSEGTANRIAIQFRRVR